MTEQFGKAYWESHWHGTGGARGAVPPHPALETEIAGLHPGAALDAGAGEGAEAGWLAAHGWEVTAVDISRDALERAAAANPGQISWQEADLTIWEPARRFELVTTFYAHPTIPQHEFFARLAGWVEVGGTLLLVSHAAGAGHGHAHPESTLGDPERIREVLGAEWRIVTAERRARSLADRHGRPTELHDVVVRAVHVADA